jgi:iron uptake system EfeUOB component EfeO/EfeM
MRSSFKSPAPAQDLSVYDPGLNRHEWESEWEALEDDLRTDPAPALPELDRLVTRMLAESGYELTDPVVGEGEEREIVAEYLAAHEIVQASERDSEDISPGDVASAINGYRAVYDHLVTTRAAADADLGTAEPEEA